MKKKLFPCAAILLTGLLFGSQAMAQGRIELGRAKSVQQCANVTDKGFTATFSFGSIDATEVNTEKGVFSNITMDGTYPTGHVGEPSLPAAHQLIAVPFGAKNATVEVKSYTTTTYRLADFGINTLAPQQPSLRKDQKTEYVKFVYDEKAYAANRLSQRPVATLEVQGTMRGIQVGSLVVNPVNYNPANNTIEVYNDIELEVRYNDYDKVAADGEFARTYSHYFRNVYKTMFNWRDDVYDQHPDLWLAPVKMLVIANRMFEEVMQPWVEWKTTKGFYVSVNYTDQIGSTPAAIRSFIQEEYDKDAPTFVIIFGDKEQVPASATGSATNCVTDLQYMSVDNDDFPDIYHSRMCAQTVEQMQNIIGKTLLYEQYVDLPDPTYLNNVLLIAGWDSYWTAYDGAPTIQYAMHYYYNAEHGFDNVYNWLGQPYTGCYAPLSSGVGFANYTAHGSHDSWADPSFSVSDVNNLTNDGKPFLAMGNCCQAADWGISSTCFGEAMIRNNSKAAYAYIGSCPNTYWYEDYYFGVGATNTFGQMPTYEQTSYGVYDAVWTDDVFNTVSSMPFIGNLAVCYAHAGNYEGSVSDKYYWQAYHALGDGSVMPFRVQPTENNVSHLPTLPIGLEYYTVSANPGSYVGISMDGVLYGAGLIGESGTADIPMQPITSGGDVTICVTHPQHIPYLNVIPAASMEGPYVAFDAVQCDQPLVSGAYVAPTVSLKNVGVETANNINVVMTTESEYIELISTTATVPAIAPGDSFTIADAFSFNTTVNIPNNTRVRFFLTCTSGDNVWESKFDLTFGAPSFEMSNISETELAAGSSATITFDIANNGGALASNAVLQVYSSSDDIMLTANSFDIGSIEAGATVQIPVEVNVASSVEVGSTYEISYLVTSGHYTLSGSHIVSVGNIMENFETNDFSMFDWTFGGSANWTIVSGQAHSGSYCAKSGSIGDSQQSDLILSVDVLSDGEVSFYKKVSSENNWDKLFFYIDNTEKGNWSGEVDWSQQTYPVTAGTHTFRWTYKKDSRFSSGSDCAWVDDIQLPPTSVTLALNPVSDLMADVDGSTVTLTWTAPDRSMSYIVNRNGEELANQAATTFTDNVADGVYTYSVVATDGDGHYSSATFVTVSVGIVGVDESSLESVTVYPNPASNTLHVSGGNVEFGYEMFNGMGQTVAKGNAVGNAEVNVGDMAKGVYFLRIASGAEVRVEKVVVE